MHLLSTTISNDIVTTKTPKLSVAYASMGAVIILALWKKMHNGQYYYVQLHYTLASLERDFLLLRYD